MQADKSRRKPKSPSCSTCKHMVAEGESGFCRRYPPSLKIDGMSSGYAPVKLEWICGEWKAKA